MQVKNSKITSVLLHWYTINKRDLPWRKDRNPYKIWLSEIILQQTRVDQGLPYYLNFIEKYPTVHDLASAPQDEVLRVWQGLGYYNRARNLHNCAKIVSKKFKGKFPNTKNELMQLPGIGPYTSAAIASFAFGEKEAVVDGNVIRVMTRLYGIEDDISNQNTINKIKSLADELIPANQPDHFNQAIMEFGALYCTPRNPSCPSCEFTAICKAYQIGIIDKIPYKSKKIKKRTRHFNYLLLEIDNKIFLRKRSNKDIWNGLFEFFLIETNSDTDFDKLKIPALMARQPRRWQIVEESKKYKHLLTHQTIMCRFYKIKIDEEFNYNPLDWVDYQLYSNEEIEQLPKSILIDKYLREKKFD